MKYDHNINGRLTLRGGGAAMALGDRPSLAVYCQAWSRLVEHEKLLAEIECVWRLVGNRTSENLIGWTAIWIVTSNRVKPSQHR